MKKLIFLLTIPFIFQCGDFGEEKINEGAGNIKGMLIDSEGKPLKDAKVFLKDNLLFFTNSDEKGEFVLENIPAGIYVLMAYSEKGVGSQKEVKVFANQTTTLNMLLSPTSTIKGKVTLAGKNDHVATIVYLLGTSFVAYTDHDGNFTIFYVIPGCYTLRAEHEGYKPKEFEGVCVEMGKEKTIDEFTLLAMEGPECASVKDCDLNQDCVNGKCIYKEGFSKEVCDGKDNDGDGIIDEGLVEICGSYTGECKLGTKICIQGKWSECMGEVKPEEEKCDGLDNDCDGIVDEGCAKDNDGDGYSPPEDCDDNDSAVYPGAPEICDKLDNNCDGIVDEGCAKDNDGDGYSPPEDCDDNDSAVYPGAPEICDKLDNNCDGIVDEGCGCKTNNDCNDNNPCTSDVCINNKCANYNISGPCDDGNLCTENDFCAEGKCTSKTTKNCDDNNNCTKDWCDPVKGCMNKVIDLCCEKDADCDDADPCTLDKCVNGSCAHSPSQEICGDGKDNNCNGQIDEGCGVLLLGEGEHCKKVDSEYKCAEGLVCKEIPVNSTPYYNCYKPCNTVSDCSGSVYENPPFNLYSQKLQCFEMGEEDICVTGGPWPVDVQGDLCAFTTVECQPCGVLTLCMSDAKFAEFNLGGGNFPKHCRKPCNSDSDCNGNRCLSVSNMGEFQTKAPYSCVITPPKKGFCCMSTDTASGCQK